MFTAGSLSPHRLQFFRSSNMKLYLKILIGVTLLSDTTYQKPDPMTKKEREAACKLMPEVCSSITQPPVDNFTNILEMDFN